MNLGDITITRGEKTIVVNYGSNTNCRLEEADGRPYSEIMAELQGVNPRVTTIRRFVKAALIAPADLTLEQVGDVIDEFGGWPLILVGLESQSPDAEKAKAALQSLEDALKASERIERLATAKQTPAKRTTKGTRSKT